MCSLYIGVSAEKTAVVEFDLSLLSSLWLSSSLTEVLRVMHKNNVMHTPLVDNVKYMDNADMQPSYKEHFNSFPAKK
jgi:hypothetical protein